MAARTIAIRLSEDHRKHIQATQLLKRLNTFALADLDGIVAAGTRMTRTQIHVALALLRKVLPDLASVEVSGNPEKPLMVQVVRFSDGEEIAEPRAILDMGKLIEMDRAETAAIEAEVKTARRTVTDRDPAGTPDYLSRQSATKSVAKSKR